MSEALLTAIGIVSVVAILAWAGTTCNGQEVSKYNECIKATNNPCLCQGYDPLRCQATVPR